MPSLKNINLNGTLLEITDSTARSSAESAVSKANNAQTTADSALTKANSAQTTADSKALITYSENEMTLFIK